MCYVSSFNLTPTQPDLSYQLPIADNIHGPSSPMPARSGGGKQLVLQRPEQPFTCRWEGPFILVVCPCLLDEVVKFDQTKTPPWNKCKVQKSTIAKCCINNEKTDSRVSNLVKKRIWRSITINRPRTSCRHN